MSRTRRMSRWMLVAAVWAAGGALAAQPVLAMSPYYYAESAQMGLGPMARDSEPLPPALDPAASAIVGPDGAVSGEGVKQGLIVIIGEEGAERYSPWLGAVGPASEFAGHLSSGQADPGSIVIEGTRAGVKTGVSIGGGLAAQALTVAIIGTEVLSGPGGWIILLGSAVVGSAAGNYVNAYGVDPAFDSAAQGHADHMAQMNLLNQTCNDRTGFVPVRTPFFISPADFGTGGPDPHFFTQIPIYHVQFTNRPPPVRIPLPPSGGRCRPGCPDFRR